MSSGGLPRTRLDLVTWATGVVAAVCVVATTTVVLMGHTGRGAHDHPPAAPSGAWPVVVGHAAHLSFRLPPGDAWTRTGPRAVAGFRSTDRRLGRGADRGADRGGDPVVFGPAYFRRGWCPQQPRWSSRALVGFGRPVRSDDPRAVNAAVSAAWLRVLAPTRLPGGVSHLDQARRGGGWLTSAVVRTAGGQPCTPPRVRLEAQSLVVGADVSTVVLVADCGVPGTLRRRVIDRIIASVGPARSEPMDP